MNTVYRQSTLGLTNVATTIASIRSDITLCKQLLYQYESSSDHSTTTISTTTAANSNKSNVPPPRHQSQVQIALESVDTAKNELSGLEMQLSAKQQELKTLTERINATADRKLNLLRSMRDANVEQENTRTCPCHPNQNS